MRPPISDSDPAADYVLENSAFSTPVGITASAIDPDGADTISYTLDSDAGGWFGIDANTGVVTVGGAIDRAGAGLRGKPRPVNLCRRARNRDPL